MSKSSENDDNLDYVRDLPGFERGAPLYFDNELIDHLIGITLELGAELWVVKDRLAFLEERLAVEQPSLLQDLDQSRPSDELQQKLDDERRKFIARIYARLYTKYGGDKADLQSAPLS